MYENNNEFETRTIDLNISFDKLRKKRISIDGDINRVIELDLADMHTLTRWAEKEKALENLAKRAQEFLSAQSTAKEEGKDALPKWARKLRSLDNEMRKILNEVFDCPNFSDMVCPSGCMYDIFNGVPRYSILVSDILELYVKNIQEQIKDTDEEISEVTSEYIKEG